jgi:general secretion pathway protein F
MTEYVARVFRPGDPAVLEQVVPASGPAEARTQLQAQGYVVLSIQAVAQPLLQRLRLSARTKAGTGRKAFALLYRELRTLVQAGMTVVEAVDTLSARERLGGTGDGLAAALLAKLEQGQALSTAVESLPGSPAVLVAAIRAGERTSNLVEALDDYLRFDALVEQLRRKVVSAAIYPSMVMALGIGISFFLLMVVLPNFARMYQGLRGAATGGTALVIATSQWVSENRALTFGLFAVAVVAFAFWVASGRAKQDLAAWAWRVPQLRSRMQDFQLAMLYQALALLLRGGYPMVEALTVAASSALSAQLKAGLERVRTRIEHGGLVSQGLSDAGLCDEVGRRLMAAAERNGEFHLAADVVSKLHAERFELFVERMTRIVEPVLLMAVALVVGGIVVAMYLPVFDMATRLR